MATERYYQYSTLNTISESSIYGEVRVPEGYEVIGFRPPRKGETFQDGKSIESQVVPNSFLDYEENKPRRILQKKKVLVITYRSLGRPPKIGELYGSSAGDGNYFITRTVAEDSNYTGFTAFNRTETWE